MLYCKVFWLYEFSFYKFCFSKKFGKLNRMLIPLYQFFEITYQERQRVMAR